EPARFSCRSSCLRLYASLTSVRTRLCGWRVGHAEGRTANPPRAILLSALRDESRRRSQPGNRSSPAYLVERELLDRGGNCDRERSTAGGELAHHPGERAPRPDLHESVAAKLEQRRDAGRPAHR